MMSYSLHFETARAPQCSGWEPPVQHVKITLLRGLKFLELLQEESRLFINNLPCILIV